MKPLPHHVHVLLRARSRLNDPALWSKGLSIQRLPDGRQAQCLVAAISQGSPPHDNLAALDAVRRALVRRRGTPIRLTGDITRWNDHHSTTHSDILSVLDEAIAVEISP
jgi:hypothetical protein